MRTFRKALCLVLAMLFVLGLCTVGASAAFNDAEKINADYANAIDTLTGLGIINGYPDGSFKPTQNVTRAEAAKMIAVMMLGENGVDKMPAGTGNFTDVESSAKWAKQAISFCASKGIIKGRGDGTFDPNGLVTGSELATMLLRAVGYGVMGEFEGKGWDVNAVTAALSEGIFEDAQTEDFSAPATREEAALYIFNAMFTNRVGYDVDLNYYTDLTGKTNFAGDTWQVDEVVVQIAKNQATGADYTVAVDGTNYKLETGLDLIAHEVKILYRDLAKQDADKNYYYVAYGCEDVSTVIPAAGTKATLFKQLVLANAANKASTSVELWENYADALTTETVDISAWQGVNKMGFLPGTVILGEDGKYLAVMTEAYTVDKVAAIDSDFNTVELKYNAAGATEYKLSDAYEGIKAGDLVTVKIYGELYKIEPTTTAEADIFEFSGTDAAHYSFNNGKFKSGAYTDPAEDLFVYAGGKSTGVSKLIKKPAAPTDITIGAKVKFYLDSNGQYFALEKLADGKSAGRVFLVRAFSTTSGGGKDEFGDPIATKTEYKVQVVTEEGEKAVYTLSTTTTDTSNYDALVDSSDNTIKGVYDLIELSGGKYRLSDERDATLGEAKKISGKTSYVEDTAGKKVYITSDTVVWYVDGDGSKLKVTKNSKLVEGKPYYMAYDFNGNATTLWICDKAPAAETVTSSYMFIGDKTQKGAQDVNGTKYNYYTVYIDGVKQEKTLIKNTGAVAVGFFTYKVTGDIYEITATTNTAVTLASGDIHDGKFFKTADGKDISGVKVVKLIPAAKDTTADGKNTLKLASIEDLEGLLDEGYEFEAWYIVAGKAPNTYPNGVIYVTDVTATP